MILKLLDSSGLQEKGTNETRQVRNRRRWRIDSRQQKMLSLPRGHFEPFYKLTKGLED